MTGAWAAAPAKLADILKEYHVCSTMLAPNGPHQEIQHESGSCEWDQEIGLDVTALEILEIILGHEQEDHGKKVREPKPPQTDAILNMGLYGFTSWRDDITEHLILCHIQCGQKLDVTAQGKAELTDQYPSFGTIGHLATICSLHKCDDGQWDYKEDYR